MTDAEIDQTSTDNTSGDADTDHLPAPLQGCLYCHTTGSTSLAESRKILGFGSNVPTLTCNSCGSIALFEAGSDPDSWRLRYKKVNKASRFYYVILYLGNAGWLNAEEALEISRNGYVQRQRIQQAQRGDLSWLSPAPLNAPPPLMSPDESVYLSVSPVTLQQASRSGNTLGQGSETVMDSGQFYVTDRKLHLIGSRRDWSHKLSDIQSIEHTEQYWRIYVGSSPQHYQGANSPDQMDAQLFTTIVKTLWKRESPSANISANGTSQP